jgi:hypothetical protein
MALLPKVGLLVGLVGVVAAVRLTGKPQTAAAPVHKVTQKDVDHARAKIEKMAMVLQGMLHDNKGLQHSHVAPTLKLFTDNLQSVLTASKELQPAEAIQKLATAQASITGMVRDLTHQQETLMHEDVEQREDLMMGVLMTNKNAPMEKQLEILRNMDFQILDVSKALLNSHDTKTALYLQAAQWLDTHKHAGGMMLYKKSAKRVEDLAASLDKRVHAAEKEAESKKRRHLKVIENLKLMVKKGGKAGKTAQRLLKRQERDYKKEELMSQRNIAMMKQAADAVRSGDMAAVKSAEQALQKSMDAFRDKNSGMLVFLQRSNAILERDCPFCAAQCVGTCHSNGKPYTECLTVCADAGK